MPSNKSKSKRRGRTTARQTTARSGKSKSAKARARSQKAQSARGGRSKSSSGRTTGRSSRTTSSPARPRRMSNRGPGDIGNNPDATGGGAPQTLKPTPSSEASDEFEGEVVE